MFTCFCDFISYIKYSNNKKSSYKIINNIAKANTIKETSSKEEFKGITFP